MDPSGELSNGSRFQDVRDFKQILLNDEAQIARNIAKQLALYATGTPVRFGDREKIERILAATKGDNYGVRSLVDQLIQSELFQNK